MTGTKQPRVSLQTTNVFKKGCVALCFALMLLTEPPKYPWNACDVD